MNWSDPGPRSQRDGVMQLPCDWEDAWLAQTCRANSKAKEDPGAVGGSGPPAGESEPRGCGSEPEVGNIVAKQDECVTVKKRKRQLEPPCKGAGAGQSAKKRRAPASGSKRCTSAPAPDPGFTYDGVANGMLASRLRSRPDRVLTRLCGWRLKSPAGVQLLGKEAIPGVTYVKTVKRKGEIVPLTLPVLPSDHFGVCVTLHRVL